MGKDTKMIVGLGNPGKKYKDTRHNIGFMVVDNLAAGLGLSFRKRFMLKAEVTEMQNLVLVKPTTYMNLSGDAVAKIRKKYGVSNENIMVVCDDLNLSFGNIRIRLKGSAGGHNGLKSIIDRLGTQEFPRIKYGIGKPDNPDKVRDFVLHKFTRSEKDILDGDIARMSENCSLWIKNVALEKIMSKVNTKQ